MMTTQLQSGTPTLEQLLFANVRLALGSSGPGYGVAGTSPGWPNTTGGEKNGGLGGLVAFAPYSGEPKSYVFQRLEIGTTLLVRDPDGNDANNRPAYRMLAVLGHDPDLHPRAAIALTRLLTFPTLAARSAAVAGDLPGVPLPELNKPIIKPSPRLITMTAHLLRNVDADKKTCLALPASRSDSLLELLETALWCIPAALTKATGFATWQRRFAASGNQFGLDFLPALDVISYAPGSNVPDSMRIAVSNEPDFYELLAAELVEYASISAVEDTVDSTQRLASWLSEQNASLGTDDAVTHQPKAEAHLPATLETPAAVEDAIPHPSFPADRERILESIEYYIPSDLDAVGAVALTERWRANSLEVNRSIGVLRFGHDSLGQADLRVVNASAAVTSVDPRVSMTIGILMKDSLGGKILRTAESALPQSDRAAAIASLWHWIGHSLGFDPQTQMGHMTLIPRSDAMGQSENATAEEGPERRRYQWFSSKRRKDGRSIN